MKFNSVKLQRDLAIKELEYNRTVIKELMIEYKKILEASDKNIRKTHKLLREQIDANLCLQEEIRILRASRVWKLVLPLRYLRKKIIRTSIKRN